MTYVVDRKVPLPIVQKQVGHRSLKTTSVYLSPSTEKMAQAYKAARSNVEVRTSSSWRVTSLGLSLFQHLAVDSWGPGFQIWPVMWRICGKTRFAPVWEILMNWPNRQTWNLSENRQVEALDGEEFWLRPDNAGRLPCGWADTGCVTSGGKKWLLPPEAQAISLLCRYK